MYDCYVKNIYKKRINAGKVQFLKNWNEKGKRRVQNMGKGVINILHKVACMILKKILILI